MRRIGIAAITALVVGSLLASVPAHASRPSRAGDANAVVAMVDTGINPYHKTFRDSSPRAYRYPGTYIPGYPKDATALHLTLDAPDYWTAVHADCERIWSKIEPGKLYWIPGTKIVGAITFEKPDKLDCNAKKPAAEGHILDAQGHGTMTSSRATSVDYGACPECRTVMVQFPTSINLLDPGPSTDPAIAAIKWAANNAGWIDAQSNSWGPLVPLWDPTGQAGLVGASPKLVRTVEEVSQKHLAFWASGNGAAFRGGALGHPTLLTPHLTPSAIIVGGVDSGYMNTWPGFPPNVASDSCDSWAAYFDSSTKSDGTVGGGTSAATPFAAGGAAHILLDARRILGDPSTGVHDGVVARGPAGLVPKGPLADGKFTLDEWKRLLYVTATPRPKAQREDGPACGPTDAPYGPTPVKWTDVPDGYPEYLQIGYGAVDDPAMALADKVLAGTADAPDRSATDQYFALDHQLRETTYQIFSTGG